MLKPMFDILNREIKEGDIVVVKGNGNHTSRTKSMEIGVRVGDTIKTLSCSRDPGDKFLVVNPTEDEIKIKEQILCDMAARKAKTKAKSAERSKQKANKVGAIYQVSRYNELFIYLGKATLDSYKDGIHDTQQVGNLYISLGTHVRDLTKYEKMTASELTKLIEGRSGLNVWHTGNIGSAFDFVKTNKIYEKLIGEVVDLGEELTIEYDCTCSINGIKPYEKGQYKIKVG